jgi:hypothetical protein
MGNIMVRMGVVIGIILAVQGGFWYVGHMSHPAIVEGQQPLENFPKTFSSEKGAWHGVDAKLDDRTWNESEVDGAVSRFYAKDGIDRKLTFLLAEYKSPRSGLYHNPMNCYRTHGFTQIGSARFRPLEADGRPATRISLTTWTSKEGGKVLVAYWYEVGDLDTMFERGDLLKTQWKMFGKTKWPVMYKVLLEMPTDNAGTSTDEIMEMAREVRQWLGRKDVRPVLE